MSSQTEKKRARNEAKEDRTHTTKIGPTKTLLTTDTQRSSCKLYRIRLERMIKCAKTHSNTPNKTRYWFNSKENVNSTRGSQRADARCPHSHSAQKKNNR